jgi:hypothetical protein
MTSGTRQFCIALLAIGTLPLLAQEHGSHSSSSAAAPSASRAMHGGGSLSGSVRISGGTANTGSRSVGHHRGHLQGGYGSYGWGAPLELPYDSEYGQMEGRGTFEQGQAEPAPDTRVGPTVFEYNGRASAAGNQPVEQSAATLEPQPAEGGSQSSTTPTVLVFRDGHQQEVENYAIAGNKLIVVGDKTERIQLSDLDLNATAKANEDRGVDFKMPHQG